MPEQTNHGQVPILRRKSMIQTYIAVIFILSIGGLVRYVYWLDQDYLLDSPCRSRLLMRIQHGMDKKQVLLLLPQHEDYNLRRKQYHGGLVVEEWNIRRVGFSEGITVKFDADGLVLGKDCGN